MPDVQPRNLALDLAEDDRVAEGPPVEERSYFTRNVRGIVNNASVQDTLSQEERNSEFVNRINESY